MLHNRKSHVSIRDYAPYGGAWEGEQVIICPLPMRQEIHDAMGEHADKKGHRRFIEHSGQGEEGPYYGKRMHSNRHGMQRGVVQERMECLYTRRLHHDGSIVRHKAQR